MRHLKEAIRNEAVDFIHALFLSVISVGGILAVVFGFYFAGELASQCSGILKVVAYTAIIVVGLLFMFFVFNAKTFWQAYKQDKYEKEMNYQ